MNRHRGIIPTLKFYCKIYIKIVKMYMKTRLQYREDYAIGFVGMIFRSILNLVTMCILFNNIETLGGYTFNHMIFLCGLYMFSITPAESLLVNIWYLNMHINQGTFIKYRLKPIDSMFYYFSEIIEFKSFTQVLIAIPLIFIYGLKIGITWSFHYVLLLIFVMLMSSIIVSELYICIACISFWVLDSSPLLDLIQQIIDISRYPTNIYNKIVGALLCFLVPIGCIAYIPMLMLLNKNTSLFIIILLLVVILFGVLCRIIWNHGVKRYTGTGT